MVLLAKVNRRTGFQPDALLVFDRVGLKPALQIFMQEA